MYAEVKISSENTYAPLKTKHKYKIKQKISGILLIVISILMPIICDGDATVSVFTLPLGTYLIFARREVMHL